MDAAAHKFVPGLIHGNVHISINGLNPLWLLLLLILHCHWATAGWLAGSIPARYDSSQRCVDTDVVSRKYTDPFSGSPLFILHDVQLEPRFYQGTYAIIWDSLLVGHNTNNNNNVRTVCACDFRLGIGQPAEGGPQNQAGVLF